MKICIPTIGEDGLDNAVGEHFGRVPTYTIVDLETDEVKVTEIKSEKVNIYELKVSKSDMGAVLGRHGQNANALRTVIAATSGKIKKRTKLEIIE